MKTKDLRLGNLVYKDGEIYRIESLGYHESDSPWQNLVHLASGDEDNICDYEPIPLTEEWLLKFGFKKYYNLSKHWYLENQYQDYDYSIRYMRKKYICFAYCGSVGCKLKPNIQYVHQLQNLYFVLTGDEIEIS